MEITQDKLNQLSTYVGWLQAYNESGRMKIDADQIPAFKRLYQEIYGVVPNTGCITCLLTYLNNLQAFYERENANWIAARQPIITSAPLQEEPCKKCGKKKSK